MHTARMPLPTLRAFAVSLFAATLLAQAPTPLTAGRVEELAKSAREQFGAQGLAVAVVQDGVVLASLGVGERAPGQPMTQHTVTNIASCSKAFTAAAVALLVHEGKLQWDDPVQKHLPEFRLADPWISSHMTVRDLLSHRCGLVTFAGDLLWYGSDYDDAEVLRRAAGLPIVQRFREQFGYQNLMYLAAGMIVAKYAGCSWEEFVEQRFFGPLGMTRSRASAQRLPQDAEKALPHIAGKVIPDHEFVACKPAASIYASAFDLTAWMRMLLDGGKWNGSTILTEDALREMWRPHVSTSKQGTGPDTGDLSSYGLGWFLSLERGQKVVEHDGGMPGFLSKVSLMPAEKFGFVVLNNSNDGVLNEAVKRALFAERRGGDGMEQLTRLAAIKRRIDQRDVAERKAREAQQKPNTHPSLALDAYVGRYEDAIYGPAEIRREGDGLAIVLLPSQRRLFGALAHWHLDTFRVDWPDAFLPFGLVRFELDHTGKVAGFRIDCPIADFDFGALDFRAVQKGQ